MEQNNSAVSQPTPSPIVVPPPTTPTTATQPINSSVPNYASFGERFVALLIDSVIMFVLAMIITVPMTFLNMMMAGSSADSTATGGIILLLSLVSQLLVSGAVLGYMIFFIGRSGQTLGKKVMKIKVVKLDTMEHPNFGGAVMRELLGKMVSGITFYIGYLWMLWDPQKQCLHDKIAGTIVVKI